MRQEAVVVLRLDQGNVPAASQAAARSIGKIGEAGKISAGQTAAAMRQLPAQFTDVATQLAGGANPLLVLLQQGGQVKDSFGGVRAAVTGVGAALTPVTVAAGALAAAVGAVGFAAYQGAQDTEELRNMLTLTGNAAALTGDRLTAASKRVADATGETVGAARDILSGLAATGTVSSRVLDSTAIAAGRVASVTGQTADEVVKDFAGMSDGVAKWALEHAKAWNFIDVAQLRYIRQLEDQGRTEEAVLFVNARITEQFKEQTSELGYLEQAWAGVTGAVRTFWEAQKNLGRNTLSTQLDDARAALGRAQRAQGVPILEFFSGDVGDAQNQVENLEEMLRLTNRLADAQGQAAGRNRAGLQFEQLLEGALPRSEKLQRELVRARALAQEAGATADELARVEDAIRKKFAERKTGGRNKAFDETPGPVDLEILDKFEARLAAIKRNLGDDPLGDFITERVLPADDQRNQQRLTQQANFLQQMVDANARANIALIRDDEARAAASLELDRQIALRRVQEAGLTDGARSEAERLVNEGAEIASRAASANLRSDVGSALRAALMDGRDPARAFAESLASSLYNRVSERLAAAIEESLLQSSSGSSGNLWSAALDFLFGSSTSSSPGFASSAGISGGRASGGPVRRGEMYEVNERDGPGELLRVGRRTYLMAAQDGQVIPTMGAPAGLEAAGGTGGGVTVNVLNQGRPMEVAGTSQRQTPQGVVVDVLLKEVASDIRRGGEVGRAMQGTYPGLNRAASAPRRG